MKQLRVTCLFVLLLSLLALNMITTASTARAATGTISEFPVPTSNAGPAGITVGPDGALWFGEFSARQIGKITTTGTISEFPLPPPSQLVAGDPISITTGPDGALCSLNSIAIRLGVSLRQVVLANFPFRRLHLTLPISHQGRMERSGSAKGLPTRSDASLHPAPSVSSPSQHLVGIHQASQ